MNRICLLVIGCFACITAASQSLTGSWDRQDGANNETHIYAGDHFAVSVYNKTGKEFAGTYGGKYLLRDGKIVATIEFDTKQPDRIGTEVTLALSVDKSDKKMMLGGNSYSRLDNGTPGELAGAWLITGRINDKGEIKRSTPGVRRTMKILSGTHFQWIAYNVETREFFGTGGGNYTTKDGKYTENIEFFSRDNTRVGASLGFDFSLVEGEWQHKGLSSKGEPIHEIWTKREKIGI